MGDVGLDPSGTGRDGQDHPIRIPSEAFTCCCQRQELGLPPRNLPEIFPQESRAAHAFNPIRSGSTAPNGIVNRIEVLLKRQVSDSEFRRNLKFHANEI
jgi:hypothetical protein